MNYRRGPSIQFLLGLFDLSQAPRNRHIRDQAGILQFEDMEIALTDNKAVPEKGNPKAFVN